MYTFILPEQSIETLAQLHLINGLFRNAFFTDLRTRQQLGYVVSSSPAGFNEYPQFLLFVQSADRPLMDLKASMDEFRVTYRDDFNAAEPVAIEQLSKTSVSHVNLRIHVFYI